jgi:hypothetical protein
MLGAAFLAALCYASPGFAAEAEINSGTVTFAKTAGSYTYIKLKGAGKEQWLAALPMDVAVGDQVEYVGGDTMKDFKSKAMNQTFDSIRFVARIHVVNKDMPMDAVHRGSKADNKLAVAPGQGEIAKPKGGKTVAELFNEKDKLSGKKVVARAKVMKVSQNILGKNWVTLADGTGKSPEDKVVATTKETPSVGAVVTVSGLLKTNVNLGAGYQYKAIIEEARFTP